MENKSQILMWSNNKGPYQNMYTQGSQVHAAHVTLTLSILDSKCFSFCCSFRLTPGVGGSGDIKIFVKTTWQTQKIENILLLGKPTVIFKFNISFIHSLKKYPYIYLQTGRQKGLHHSIYIYVYLSFKSCFHMHLHIIKKKK